MNFNYTNYLLPEILLKTPNLQNIRLTKRSTIHRVSIEITPDETIEINRRKSLGGADRSLSKFASDFRDSSRSK